MTHLIRLALFTFLFIFVFGCSLKDQNKTAPHIYAVLLKAVQSSDLERADNYYSTLRAQHFHSPLLKEASLIMAFAHANNEQHLLANFYLDIYLQRFADDKSAEFIHFLKLQSNYFAFRKPNRDQKLLLDTIQKIDNQTQIKSDGFKALKESIKIILIAKEYLMNKKIAKLYAKLDKKDAQKIYSSRIVLPKDIKIKPHEWSFLEWLFE